MFKGISKVDKLRVKSDAIVTVFTKTIDDLKNVNDEIEKHRIEKLEEKANIEADIQKLEESSKSNATFITNLQQLFTK